MAQRVLTALPVFNEAAHVEPVLCEVKQYSSDVLVVDDGSTDATPQQLAKVPGIRVIRHAENQGYGAALRTAFEYAIAEQFDVLVTIDCDGQHQPQRIPRFAEACARADIVSGSRYLQTFHGDSAPPQDRRRINQIVTTELNRRLCLQLTDGFCGFKAYRVSALRHLKITEVGYAMPIELWVQAAAAGLRVIELPVPLIYLDEKRSFGGALDDATTRLEYYHLVLDRSIAALEQHGGKLWPGTICGEVAG